MCLFGRKQQASTVIDSRHCIYDVSWKTDFFDFKRYLILTSEYIIIFKNWVQNDLFVINLFQILQSTFGIAFSVEKMEQSSCCYRVFYSNQIF